MASYNDLIIYRAIDELSWRGLSNLHPAILEKDFMVTKVLGLLANLNWANYPFTPVFCGGTALAKGHKLIQRMSEDIDFRLVPLEQESKPSRGALRTLRKALHQQLVVGGFDNVEVMSRNESRYMRFLLHYQSYFPKHTALLPEIKLELAVGSTFLNPLEIQVKSLLSEILEREEALNLHQVLNPEETMVEKVVAFLRRTAGWVEDGWPQKERSPEDQRLVRHLYDVQQLLQQRPLNPEGKATRKRLLQKVVAWDRKQFRGKDEAFASDPSQRLGHALAQLHTHAADFAKLYRRFVGRLVWGPVVEFGIAQAAFAHLAEELLDANHGDGG